ncbi:MAG: hypothetical protein IT385_31180 [Deltaproteobacteria bacterium]|nr:hypothetical protein [Deltaproteobacteria bacterium]
MIESAGGAVPGRGTACGKAILLGEHFVVHGSSAIAVPLLGHGVTASLVARDEAPPLEPEVGRLVDRMLLHLGLDPRALGVRVTSTLPIASGLGSSAALAVALVRATGETELTAVRERAHALERLAHGNPSGVDDAVVSSERSVLFRRGAEPAITLLDVPIPALWVAVVPRSLGTREAVAGVARWRDAHRTTFEGMLAAMGTMVDEALVRLAAADEPRMGALLDRAHALLETIGVVDRRHAAIVDAARRAGAFGAKTTGAGHGGAVIVMAPPALDLRAPLMAAGAEQVFHTGGRA